jgi:hypothetical protein
VDEPRASSPAARRTCQLAAARDSAARGYSVRTFVTFVAFCSKSVQRVCRWWARACEQCSPQSHLLTRSQDGLHCEANSLSLRSGERVRERGGREIRDRFQAMFSRLSLSPALSPLVPRGEREKTKRRLPPVPLSPILRTPLYAHLTGCNLSAFLARDRFATLELCDR